MEKHNLVLLMLLVLLLITTIQALQLNALTANMSGISITTEPSVTATQILPQSLQNLPNMVGGC